MDITQKCIDFFSSRKVKSNLEKYGLVYDVDKVNGLLVYLSKNKQEIKHNNVELHIAALYYRINPFIIPPTKDAYPYAALINKVVYGSEEYKKLIKDNEKL